MSLAGRVAVISGATGAAGRAAAGRLAQEGARLALLSSNVEKLEALAGDLSLPEKDVLTLAGDLTTAQAAQSAARAVLRHFGKAEILLHMIGGWTGGKLVTEFSPEEFARMLDQHLWSTLHLVQAFLPHLLANGWGRVVVVSSPAAELPPAKASPYAVAKAAQEALILATAQEVRGSGVTANILRVSAIDASHARLHNPSPANAGWATPEEIAETLLYLCSDAASQVNGARLPLLSAPA